MVIIAVGPLRIKFVGGLSVAQENRTKRNAAHREAIANFKGRMKSYVDRDESIPVATGYLKESATDVIGRSKTNVGGGFEAHFGFDAVWAKWMDEGRVPAWPPINEIEAWCIAKSLPLLSYGGKAQTRKQQAWMIARHLSKYPIPGKNFFEPGVAYAKMVLTEELTRAYRKYGLEARVNIT